MEFCAGTGIAARACTMLDQDRKLDEWDLDSDVLSAAERELVLTSALPV